MNRWTSDELLSKFKRMNNTSGLTRRDLELEIQLSILMTLEDALSRLNAIEEILSERLTK